jgi:hypothetical protein
MDKKAKAEAKRARRNERKLMPDGANHPDEAQDFELNPQEAESINSKDSS